VGDFGRTAALRFCELLSNIERDRILAVLPRGAPFYDEYRRIGLALVGDLRFIKADALAPFRDSGVWLDDSVLIGFDRGLLVEAVSKRIGVLAFHAMSAAVQRGCRRVQVLMPCNTLATAAWSLEEQFATAESIATMVREVQPRSPADLESVANRIAGEVDLVFPSVPESVVGAVDRAGGRVVLPLGTVGVAEAYREAAKRLNSPVQVVEVAPSRQASVLAAIQEGISDVAEGRQRGRELLDAVAAEECRVHGSELIVVEACTDLDYGIGLSSTKCYAEAVVTNAYET